MSSKIGNCRNGSLKEKRRRSNRNLFLDEHTSTRRGKKRFNLKLGGLMPNSNPFHQLLTDGKLKN
tara:strand:- start:1966 stop:2160 length:195 start_codon:yes stop_codon:yes gene_type:complete